jgi:hypothetical protein
VEFLENGIATVLIDHFGGGLINANDQFWSEPGLVRSLVSILMQLGL